MSGAFFLTIRRPASWQKITLTSFLRTSWHGFLVIKWEKSILFDVFSCHYDTAKWIRWKLVKFRSVHRIRRTCSFEVLKISTLDVEQIMCFRIADVLQIYKYQKQFSDIDFKASKIHLKIGHFFSGTVHTRCPKKSGAFMKMLFFDFETMLSKHLYIHCYETPQYILSHCANDISTEFKSMRSHEHDNKLSTFSYLYKELCLQTYLSFGLPKQITKELTKIRISSHDLLIEQGWYFWPKIP